MHFLDPWKPLLLHLSHQAHLPPIPLLDSFGLAQLPLQTRVSAVEQSTNHSSSRHTRLHPSFLSKLAPHMEWTPSKQIQLIHAKPAPIPLSPLECQRNLSSLIHSFIPQIFECGYSPPNVRHKAGCS